MTLAADQSHPGVELLRQFDSGELRGPEADSVEAHLETCVECCQTLRGLPGDPLLDNLRAAGRLATEAVPSASPPSAPAPSELDVPVELRDHPRYRILGLLGKGGMGSVYRAEHRLMKRTVALKVLDRAFTARPEMVDRFRQEVRAAAHLTHPHIVQAFDAEQAGGVHFLVMEFIRGTDLAQIAARGPLPVAEACACVRQAALGLQHAFEHGMTHRDVKPHNLILGEDGTVKILDFGLARLNREAGEASGVTGEGMILGTADYMAPEQADDPHNADVRSDIYALGCTLYHLLSGRVPFPGGVVTSKLRAHAEKEPPPLRDHRPDVPEELAAVVARAMAKAPADRFATPADVADALIPFAATCPSILLTEAVPAAAPAFDVTEATPQWGAIPTEAPARSQGRTRRRAVAATVLVLLALGLLAGAVYRIQTNRGELVITVADADVEVTIKQNGELVEILDTRTKKRLRLAPGEYDLGLKGADGFQLDIQKVTIRRGKEELVTVERLPKVTEKKPPEKPTPQDKAFDPPPGLVWGLTFLTGHIDKPALSADGRFVAVYIGAQLGAVYDVRDRREVFQFPSMGLMAFTRDGKYLVSNHEHNHVALFRMPSGKKVRNMTGELPRLNDLYVSPDSRLVLGNSGATSTVWDLETGEIVRPRRWNSYFSHGGRHVIGQSLNGPSNQVFTLANWELSGTVPDADFDDRLLALLPDDRTLLRCRHRTRTGEFWDITTGKKTREFDLGSRYILDSYLRGAVSSDGKRLLTSHSDGYMRLWNLAAGREVWRIPVDLEMKGLTFSADSRFAAAGCGRGACYVWRLPDANGPYPPTPKTHRTLADGTREHEWNCRIYHTAYSPDGKHYLATADWGQVRVWSAETGELVQVLPGRQWATFTPNGKHVLAVGTDFNSIRTWDVASGKEVEAQRLLGHTLGVESFELTADGKRVLSSAWDGTIRLWDLQAGKELGKAVGQPAWPGAVLSPEGKQALSQGPDGTVLLWDLPGCKQVRQWKLPEGESLHALQFLAKPDEGRFVAVTSRAVRWFSLDAAEEVRPALKHDGQPGSEGNVWWRLFPDGRHLILMVDLSLRVIDLPSGKERARFQAPADLFGPMKMSPFRICAPSPDGRWLVAPAEHIEKGIGRVYRFPLPAAP